MNNTQGCLFTEAQPSTSLLSELLDCHPTPTNPHPRPHIEVIGFMETFDRRGPIDWHGLAVQ